MIETKLIAVQDLQCLMDRYLEPLKDETFLSVDDIEHLFIKLLDINRFQRNFLNRLETCQFRDKMITTESSTRVSYHKQSVVLEQEKFMQAWKLHYTIAKLWGTKVY